MRFDDRLLTVLNQPAEDRHDAAIRWRQLVDLVARAGPGHLSPTVAAALEAIRNEAHGIDEQLRAAAARAVAGLPLPSALLHYFASESLAISAPILATAKIDAGQWVELHAVASNETRAFIETLHPDLKGSGERARPPPADRSGFLEEHAAAYIPPALQQIVERIEKRRAERSEQQVSRAGVEPRSKDPPALFKWECGPGGEIAWVEGAPRGALIGRSIARPVELLGDRIDEEVARAFAVRAPFRDRVMTMAAAGPVTGEWKISGVPAFEPQSGRFAGYRGVALREERIIAHAVIAGAVPEILSDPASLRELVHEVKTPLNAIIGFAEIIEGQYLGPADRGYRSRAAEIVKHARLLLTAIDDLDFAAKLQSAVHGRTERVDLAGLLDREAAQLRELAGKKGAHVEILNARFDVAAKVSPELADRLLYRLFTVLSEIVQRGECLTAGVELSGTSARLFISRPIALQSVPDVELFGDTSAGDRAAFMLRLTRGLAHIAGGDLVSTRDALALVFQRA